MNIDAMEEQANTLRKVYPQIRVGQSLMLSLREMDKVLYDGVRSTECDCFYEDRNIPALYVYLYGNDAYRSSALVVK